MKAKNILTEIINLDFLLSSAKNQRLYLKNLNYLTGKKITGIKVLTFENFQTDKVNNIGLPEARFFTLNLVDISGKLIIENLSVADLAYNQGVTKLYEVGLPITGVFDFDKSWITQITPIVTGFGMVISFYYN